MAKKSDADTKTLELIQEVKRQRDEISKAERPNFITNCSFSYTENPSSAINLHVENNVRNLICIAAFLTEREKQYADMAKQLGVSEAPAFNWGGYSVADWLSDIKLRINKIQLGTKKKKLVILEERLNAIISPELKREMELEAISAELK